MIPLPADNVNDELTVNQKKYDSDTHYNDTEGPQFTT